VTALLVVCGALAREVITARDSNGWDAKVVALPASLHNRPKDIPAAVERRVAESGAEFEPVIVVYGECGPRGELGRLLRERGWLGLSGPHCYAAYAGGQQFDEMMRDEPGTFFLTDYLVEFFDHLVIKGLGLDRFPDLSADYFGNYRRVVYLQQRRDATLLRKATLAAEAIGLPLEIRFTGLVTLEEEIEELLKRPTAPAGLPRESRASVAMEEVP
jgi:hypothetical protein